MQARKSRGGGSFGMGGDANASGARTLVATTVVMGTARRM
jgi:hypothetical protein